MCHTHLKTWTRSYVDTVMVFCVEYLYLNILNYTILILHCIILDSLNMLLFMCHPLYQQMNAQNIKENIRQFSCFELKMCKEITKHWTQHHLNINIKVRHFFTLYTWVLVGLTNKGVFFLNFQGKEESIMQNKSTEMHFDAWPSESRSAADFWAFVVSWTLSLTVEMIKKNT